MDELCGLYYETKCRRFVDVQGVIPVYAWDETPTQQTMTFEHADNTDVEETTEGMPFVAPTDEGVPF